MENSGEKINASRNKNPVVTAVSPVLPPSVTPEALSTNVVVVEVPSNAPTLVATASAINAPLIFGSLPFLSSMSALEATPIKVPRVSNISTNRNASSTTMKLAMLTPEKSPAKHWPKVFDSAEKSVRAKVGYRE